MRDDEEWFRQWKLVRVVRPEGSMVGEDLPGVLLEDLCENGRKPGKQQSDVEFIVELGLKLLQEQELAGEASRHGPSGDGPVDQTRSPASPAQ